MAVFNQKMPASAKLNKEIIGVNTVLKLINNQKTFQIEEKNANFGTEHQIQFSGSSLLAVRLNRMTLIS